MTLVMLTQEPYVDEDMEVPFACFESDGVTPIDCSGGGSVSLLIWREGLKPFSLSANTGNAGDATAWDPATASGTFLIKTATVDIPVGLARVMLRATTGQGRTRTEFEGWMRFRR